MTKFAIDIDDTLYSFREAARDELLRRATALKALDDNLRGAEAQQYEIAAYATWNDWRTPNDLLGTSVWMDVIDSTHEHDAILSRDPYEGAAQVCQELFKAGHEIMYLSSRKDHTIKATYNWLLNNDFPLDGEGGRADLVVTGSDKLPLLDFHKVDVLIDDRPRTVIRFVFGAANGYRCAFVKMGEWNHNLTDVPGVFVAPTWLGLRGGLVKKGYLE